MPHLMPEEPDSRSPRNHRGSLVRILVNMVVSTCLFLAAACLDQDSHAICSDTAASGPRPQSLYFATSEPGVIALTPREQRAIVKVEPILGPAGGFCTGTVIAPTWVLTAKHCDPHSAIVVVFGDDGHPPIVAANALSTVLHPDLDLMLVELPDGVVDESVEPLSLQDTALDDRWIGAVAQLAGFGETETLDHGALAFLAAEVVAVDTTVVVVDGRGRGAACMGDSGGPLLLWGHDASIRVAAVLSKGDASCLDQETCLRTDTVSAWIAQYVDLTSSPAFAGCRGVGEQGFCQAVQAIWCDDGTLLSQECGRASECGWDASANGYRCVPRGIDPCGGVTFLGKCDAERITRCENGALVDIDCAACDAVCGRDTGDGHARCLEPM